MFFKILKNLSEDTLIKKLMPKRAITMPKRNFLRNFIPAAESFRL